MGSVEAFLKKICFGNGREKYLPCAATSESKISQCHSVLLQASQFDHYTLRNQSLEAGQ